MKRFLQLLQENLSEDRLSHSLGVARTAFYLAKKHLPAKKEKAFLAGIAHDIAREWPAERMIAFLKDKGYDITPEDKLNTVVLHAPAGAYFIRDMLRIYDEEIFNAVSRHTLGAVGMTDLDMIIFLADLIEPGRNFAQRQNLLIVSFQDLKRGMLLALENTLEYLTKKNKTVDSRTTLVLNYFREEVAKKDSI
ncbi:bis(5'-nucleosyl)-tetraphosphatase (symmetrical) YqeK [Carboxydothermus pertinax]|uniref:bis(5'-nucleosyl)-tetraphosphatase (symmetrical) n=1 Tax=Carboxydothermus pertinax TaxID=870242 RepID=A0A1L8CS03_9THEO|nr:bis(5'-nucleosyl)-tetraphosphatase (symmetrical) YqeK [Carboxydothermus pertinax]GAV21706.1 metal-dependent phosphohydrolase [Carboxydothermus pertinax]